MGTSPYEWMGEISSSRTKNPKQTNKKLLYHSNMKSNYFTQLWLQYELDILIDFRSRLGIFLINSKIHVYWDWCLYNKSAEWIVSPKIEN